MPQNARADNEDAKIDVGLRRRAFILYEHTLGSAPPPHVKQNIALESGLICLCQGYRPLRLKMIWGNTPRRRLPRLWSNFVFSQLGGLPV